MMSNKWTFSLTILITLLALAFIVPSASAAVLGKDFKTTIMLTGDNVAGNNVTRTGADSIISVVFGKAVADGEGGTGTTGDGFDVDDVTIAAFNKMTGASVTITVGNPTLVPGTMNEYTVGLGDIAANTVVLVTIKAGVVKNNDPADVIKAGTGDDTLGMNAKATLQFDVAVAVVETNPKTVSISDYPTIVLGPGIHDAFTFKVTLSEKPKEFKKDKIDLANATISDDPIALPAMTEGTPGDSTEESNRVYPYLVTVAPKYESKDDIVIKIKEFEDTSTPANKSLVSMAYMVKVNSDANKKVGQSGTKVELDKDFIIPKDGYLIVARKIDESYITKPGDAKEGAAAIARRVEAKKQTYNMIEKSLGINLEGFLIRGGTIDLVSPSAGLKISEIMWATDAGGADRQWIEIHNTSGAEIKLGDKTTKFMIYEAGEVLPDMSVAANNIQDRVSTLYKGTNHWSIAGKGQSGRTDEKVTETIESEATVGEGDDAQKVKVQSIDLEVVATDRLISMERVMDTAGMYLDGTMAGSWAASMLPARNFIDDKAGGLFVGSPGASAINPVADVVVTPEPEPTPVSAAMPKDIMISEIMVDTGSGRFPQWIELTSMAAGEVSLEGWEMVIDNAIDADVLGGGSPITVSLSGVTLDVSAHTGNTGKGQSALVVAWAAQRMSDNIRADRVINVATQLGQTRRYQLLSYNGFRIALVPPGQEAIAAFGDIAGNLDEDWELPMDGRSSLIRREMLDNGTATMGTDANGWTLASSTGLTTGQPSYYGDDEDEGTPGHDTGGPLPVELSHFRPARDKATGAVVITWATQSELNNAGFFIKRSQQRTGEFKVINATMVAGAGTTSEKQFYTYTDTTAQPNIVYYYQIEDVSLDGQRQTLTNGIRLKGHIGAAGKLTSTWGEIKASNE